MLSFISQICVLWPPILLAYWFYVQDPSGEPMVPDMTAALATAHSASAAALAAASRGDATVTLAAASRCMAASSLATQTAAVAAPRAVSVNSPQPAASGGGAGE